MPLIREGKKVPAFSLPDRSGVVRSLQEFLGAPLVLYFYPKDDSKGCTSQACDFRDAAAKFEKLGATVVGVSPDDEASHSRFALKNKLRFALLADPPGRGGTPKVCNKFGVWQEKSLYGKKYMGVVRTTYLIDATGRVVKRWDNVKVPGHVEEVRSALDES